MLIKTGQLGLVLLRLCGVGTVRRLDDEVVDLHVLVVEVVAKEAFLVLGSGWRLLTVSDGQ